MTNYKGMFIKYDYIYQNNYKFKNIYKLNWNNN